MPPQLGNANLEVKYGNNEGAFHSNTESLVESNCNPLIVFDLVFVRKDVLS
jgi:hypothetical protein